MSYLRDSYQPFQTKVNLSGVPVSRTEEINEFLIKIVHIIQAADFKSKKELLKKKKHLPQTNKTAKFWLFKNGKILKVSGGLEVSMLSSEAKQQVVLPSINQLVKLLLKIIHKQNNISVHIRCFHLQDNVFRQSRNR